MASVGKLNHSGECQTLQLSCKTRISPSQTCAIPRCFCNATGLILRLKLSLKSFVLSYGRFHPNRSFAVLLAFVKLFLLTATWAYKPCPVRIKGFVWNRNEKMVGVYCRYSLSRRRRISWYSASSTLRPCDNSKASGSGRVSLAGAPFASINAAIRSASCCGFWQISL